jgi:hypothetical protein
MNQSKVGKWARRVVWAMLLAVPAIGCSPLSVIGFIFARPDKMPAEYPLTFDKDSPKKDKEEIVVALLPQLAPGTKAQFVTADRDLATKLSKALPEQFKDNKDKKKMRVISPTQVDKFKMANPQWKQMSAEEIGKKLGADFVLEIYLDKMRMYQPGSLDNIYEGHAEVSVTVYEVGYQESDYKGKYQEPGRYPLTFAFPKTGVRDASTMSASEFKKMFLENLTVEIIRQHVDSRPSSGIADQ